MLASLYHVVLFVLWGVFAEDAGKCSSDLHLIQTEAVVEAIPQSLSLDASKASSVFDFLID